MTNLPTNQTTTKPNLDAVLADDVRFLRDDLLDRSRTIYREWLTSYPEPPDRFYRAPPVDPLILAAASLPTDVRAPIDEDIRMRDAVAIAAVNDVEKFLDIARSWGNILPSVALGKWATDYRSVQFSQTIEKTAFLANTISSLPLRQRYASPSATLDRLGDELVKRRCFLLMDEAHQVGRVLVDSWRRLSTLSACLHDSDPVRFLFCVAAAARQSGTPSSSNGWGACWFALLPDPILLPSAPSHGRDSLSAAWNTTNARFLMDRSIAWGWSRPDPKELAWSASSTDLAALLLAAWVSSPGVPPPGYSTSWGADLSDGPDAALYESLRAKTDPWKVLPATSAPQVLAWAMGLSTDTPAETLADLPETAVVLNALRHRLRAHQRNGIGKRRFLMKNWEQVALFQDRLEALPGWTADPKDWSSDLTLIQRRLPNGATLPATVEEFLPLEAVPQTRPISIAMEYATGALWVVMMQKITEEWNKFQIDQEADSSLPRRSFDSPVWLAMRDVLMRPGMLRSLLVHSYAEDRDKVIAIALPLLGPQGPSGLLRMENGDTAVHVAVNGHNSTWPAVSVFQKILLRARSYGSLHDLKNDTGNSPISFFEKLTPKSRSDYEKLILKEVVTNHRKPSGVKRPARIKKFAPLELPTSEIPVKASPSPRPRPAVSKVPRRRM